MSYDDTSTDGLNLARGLLGDTAAVELLTDDHIETVLGMYATFGMGLAFLATELDMRFARQPSSIHLPSGLSVAYARRSWQSLIIAARAGLYDVDGVAVLSHVPIDYGIAEAPEEFDRGVWP